jgi:hypothetical protein
VEAREKEVDMGLLDKAKDLATKAAEEAQKAAGAAKDKVDDVQARRKADDMAKQLGYLIVRERTDGAPAGEEADRLVAEITAVEAELAAEAAPEAPANGDTPAP